MKDRVERDSCADVAGHSGLCTRRWGWTAPLHTHLLGMCKVCISLHLLNYNIVGSNGKSISDIDFVRNRVCNICCHFDYDVIPPVVNHPYKDYPTQYEQGPNTVHPPKNCIPGMNDFMIPVKLCGTWLTQSLQFALYNLRVGLAMDRNSV